MSVSISLQPGSLLDRLALLGGMKRMSLITSGSNILICAERPGLTVVLLSPVQNGTVAQETSFALDPMGNGCRHTPLGG